jgi:hypothetical protein
MLVSGQSMCMHDLAVQVEHGVEERSRVALSFQPSERR